MSGRKSNLIRYQTAASITMSADIISSVTSILNLDNIGMQFNFIGTPEGNFDAQVSIDYEEGPNKEVINPGNWVSIDFGTQPRASALPDNIFLDINQISAPWIRYKYTFASGSGILSSFVSGKMV